MFLFTTPPAREPAPANPVVDAIRQGRRAHGRRFRLPPRHRPKGVGARPQGTFRQLLRDGSVPVPRADLARAREDGRIEARAYGLRERHRGQIGRLPRSDRPQAPAGDPGLTARSAGRLRDGGHLHPTQPRRARSRARPRAGRRRALRRPFPRRARRRSISSARRSSRRDVPPPPISRTPRLRTARSSTIARGGRAARPRSMRCSPRTTAPRRRRRPPRPSRPASRSPSPAGWQAGRAAETAPRTAALGGFFPRTIAVPEKPTAVEPVGEEGATEVPVSQPADVPLPPPRPASLNQAQPARPALGRIGRPLDLSAFMSWRRKA